jgi:hypothetical protein
MNSPSPRDYSRLGFALAAVLLLVSLLLPAFRTEIRDSNVTLHHSGFECARFALSYPFELNRQFHDWIYISAFNVTNLALLILPILAFTKRFGRFSPLLPWLVAACFLHTASWWFGEKQHTQSGYYVWLLAVGVLFAACVARVRSQKQPAEPIH